MKFETNINQAKTVDNSPEETGVNEEQETNKEQKENREVEINAAIEQAEQLNDACQELLKEMGGEAGVQEKMADLNEETKKSLFSRLGDKLKRAGEDFKSKMEALQVAGVIAAVGVGLVEGISAISTPDARVAYIGVAIMAAAAGAGAIKEQLKAQKMQEAN